MKCGKLGSGRARKQREGCRGRPGRHQGRGAGGARGDAFRDITQVFLQLCALAPAFGAQCEAWLFQPCSLCLHGPALHPEAAVGIFENRILVTDISTLYTV